jgi:IS element ISTsi1 orfA, putative resolvase
MIKTSQLTKDTYKPKDIAQFLGVTTRTLQNWDKDDKIHFQRDTISNRRFMSKDDVIKLLDDNGLLFDDTIDKKRDIIYARVSSHDQKAYGDLDRQVQFLIDSNDDLQNVLVLSEVGSGLNDKRKKLQQLLKMVMNNEVNRVFITYRDRLTRFGFHYLETMFNLKGVEIIIVKQQTEVVSVEQELMNDMMSLIASFSGKLYGMRSKQNRKKV